MNSSFKIFLLLIVLIGLPVAAQTPVDSSVTAVGGQTRVCVDDNIAYEMGGIAGICTADGRFYFNGTNSFWDTAGDINLNPAGGDVFVDANINFVGAQSITSDAGDITIGPTGNVIINSDLFTNTANGSALLDRVPGATTPTVIPRRSDLTTGMTSRGNGGLSLTAGAIEYLRVDSGGLQYVVEFEGTFTNSPLLRNIISSATIPNILTDKTDLTTGIGGDGVGELSLIASSVEMLRVDNSPAAVSILATLDMTNGSLITDSSTTLELGMAAASNHSLGAGDVILGGKLEVDDVSFFDGAATFAGVALIGDILQITPKVGAPATCAIGDFYVDTSGAACACSATNTWSNMHGTGTCV